MKTQIANTPTILPVLALLGDVLFRDASFTAALSLLGSSGDGSENTILANSIELAVMICAAVSMVIIKYLSGRYSPRTLTAMQIFGVFVFFSSGAFFVFSIESAPLETRSDRLGIVLGKFRYPWCIRTLHLGLERAVSRKGLVIYQSYTRRRCRMVVAG